MRTKIWMLAVVTAGLALPVAAHDLSFNECVEGSDFILHAAQSRDAGMSRDDFINRMHGDIALIQAYPPELRWFVQDEDDEVLLVSHAEKVFDAPRTPDTHQTEFLAQCTARMAEQGKAREALRAAEAESR